MIPALYKSRGFWLRQIRLWHRVTAAASLAGMLLFSVTGLMLNNPGLFKASTTTEEASFLLPAGLLPALADLPEAREAELPPEISGWLVKELGVEASGHAAEIGVSEIYISLPVAGGDGWLTLDRASGEGLISQSSGGWAAYLNDLHKGRNTGAVWGWFIDLLAIACILFTLTGLGLVWMQSRQQKANAPLGWASLVLPLVIALMFLH